MEVYIVRIYRRDEGDSRNVAGIVEEPGESWVKPFAGMDELCGILGRKRPPARKRKTKAESKDKAES